MRDRETETEREIGEKETQKERSERKRHRETEREREIGEKETEREI